MLQLLMVVVGAFLGFAGSRVIRRSTGRRSPSTTSAAPVPEAVAPRPPTPVTTHRPTAPAGTASLARTDGEHRERHELGRDLVTVGRSADQDITLTEARVSRHHGTFRRTPSGWTYTDDGSSNGSRLNGQPVSAGRPVPLRHGDRVEVGPATFVFRQLPSSPS